MYYCPEEYVNETQIGQSWDCDGMYDNMAPWQCRGGLVFAGWAIGAHDFYFPEFSILIPIYINYRIQ